MIIKKLIASFFIFNIFLLNPAFATVRSQIGDGTRYYCESNIESDGINYVGLYKTSNGQILSFSSTIAKLDAEISKLKRTKAAKIAVRASVTALNLKIKSSKTTRSDIIRCRDNGTTGKNTSGDGSNVQNVNACSVIGGRSVSNLRIIGGTKCTVSDGPVVFITVIDNFGREVSACTGTVVRNSNSGSAKHVIFAAHCTEGGNAIIINTSNGQMVSKTMRAFPEWGTTGILEQGDVAVASFNSAISNRSALILPNSDITRGETGVIGGFGLDENGLSSESRLKAGLVKIFSFTQHGISITYDGTGANTCNGDSGGPLFLNRNGIWYLAGVTSNGELSTCGIGDTSNFANLKDPDVAAWVNSQMN